MLLGGQHAPAGGWLAGLPGAGVPVPPAAVRAGIGEQDLAAGAGENPRDAPGEHPPAAVGGQAAGAVAGAGQLAPPARGAPHAGRGGHLGQASALVTGKRHPGQRFRGDPGGSAERGQVWLVQLMQPRFAGALVAVDPVPVHAGEVEDVADADVQQVSVGSQPAVECLAGQRGQPDRYGRHERPSPLPGLSPRRAGWTASRRRTRPAVPAGRLRRRRRCGRGRAGRG